MLATQSDVQATGTMGLRASDNTINIFPSTGKSESKSLTFDKVLDVNAE